MSFKEKKMNRIAKLLGVSLFAIVVSAFTAFANEPVAPAAQSITGKVKVTQMDALGKPAAVAIEVGNEQYKVENNDKVQTLAQHKDKTVKATGTVKTEPTGKSIMVTSFEEVKS